jgi:hypothetical protein
MGRGARADGRQCADGEDERKKKLQRAERFNLETKDTVRAVPLVYLWGEGVRAQLTGRCSQLEEKKMARAERFGLNAEEKRRLERAKRFGLETKETVRAVV